jgi:hypothetical protein
MLRKFSNFKQQGCKMRQRAATGCPGASANRVHFVPARRGRDEVIVQGSHYHDYLRYYHRFSGNYQALSGHYHHYLYHSGGTI